MSEPKIIDAEFEDIVPSNVRKPSDVTSTFAEACDKARVPVERFRPDLAERLAETAKTSRTLGQELDAAVDAAKRAGSKVKEVATHVGAIARQVRPSARLHRRF